MRNEHGIWNTWHSKDVLDPARTLSSPGRHLSNSGNSLTSSIIIGLLVTVGSPHPYWFLAVTRKLYFSLERRLKMSKEVDGVIPTFELNPNIQYGKELPYSLSIRFPVTVELCVTLLYVRTSFHFAPPSSPTNQYSIRYAKIGAPPQSVGLDHVRVR